MELRSNFRLMKTEESVSTLEEAKPQLVYTSNERTSVNRFVSFAMQERSGVRPQRRDRQRTLE